jgi:hypothetical protein
MRFRDVEEVAEDPKLRELLAAVQTAPATQKLLRSLSDPEISAKQLDQLLKEFEKTPAIVELQARFEELASERSKADSNGSWFLTDASGLQLARYRRSATTGRNYAWRSYFHGGKADHDDTKWRPGPDEHVGDTQLSAAYRSQSSNRWVVAISTPITRRIEGKDKPEFLGVVAKSDPIDERMIDLPEGSSQFAVLIDGREGASGLVLQHPLFEAVKKYEEDRLPERFAYRADMQSLPDPKTGEANYTDPLGKDEEGEEYRQRFLAAQAPIKVRGERTGWLVVVQDSFDGAIGGTIDGLRRKLMTSGQIALAFIAVVMLGLWSLVVRMSEKPAKWKPVVPPTPPSMAETLPARRQDT